MQTIQVIGETKVRNAFDQPIKMIQKHMKILEKMLIVISQSCN